MQTKDRTHVRFKDLPKYRRRAIVKKMREAEPERSKKSCVNSCYDRGWAFLKELHK